MSATDRPSDEILDHVVVGAGLAGLAYAWRRVLGGRRVLLLEAADRTGGRIATERVDGYIFDHGPVEAAGPSSHLRALLAMLPTPQALAEPPAAVGPPLLWTRRGLVRDGATFFEDVLRRPSCVLSRLPLLGRRRPRRSEAVVPRVFEGGTATLTEALSEALDERVRLGRRVQRVRPRASRDEPCVLEMEDGDPITAREVAIDVPADEQARLLASEAPHHADVLAAVVQEPVITASVGLGPRDAGRLPPVAGFRRGETVRARILDAVFTSVLAPGRAPEGHALVTLRLGGAWPGIQDLDDETLARIAAVDLGRALGTRLAPDLVRVHHDPRGRLRRASGHQGRMAALAAALDGRGIRLLGRVALGDSLDRLASVGAPVPGPLPEGVVA